MSKIAIIGAGLIGQGWAVVFAQAGHDVAMYDLSDEAARSAMKAMQGRIADLASYDLIDAADAPKILGRIKVAPSLEGALDDAIYVQENGPEEVEVKQKITHALDAIAAKDVPIGSSTSGISASRFSEDVPGRHRCLVVHPINPPHLIPAVEIVPAPWTDKSVVSQVNDLMIQCRRETIVLGREVDGFIVNRLQGALLEEAFKLVGSGIVSAADLDKAVCDGLGLRWSFMGPMQTIHLNAPGGVGDYVARYGGMFRNFALGPYDDVDWESIAKHRITPEMTRRIPIAGIPGAQADRDRKLMALLRHKKHSGES